MGSKDDEEGRGGMTFVTNRDGAALEPGTRSFAAAQDDTNEAARMTTNEGRQDDTNEEVRMTKRHGADWRVPSGPRSRDLRPPSLCSIKFIP